MDQHHFVLAVLCCECLLVFLVNHNYVRFSHINPNKNCHVRNLIRIIRVGIIRMLLLLSSVFSLCIALLSTSGIRFSH